MKPSLRLPFHGMYPVTLAFSAIPASQEIRKKFLLWGLKGHHGIDYGLPQGTEVLACADGIVIQAGEHGDFGISITLQHSWGHTLYAHLSKLFASAGKQVKTGTVLGLSGKTGVAFGPHLHFGLRLTSTDHHNGYRGFVDPAPYFKR